MIDDGLRPIVTEFIVEMLNDPHCKSILLDVGEDAMVDSDPSSTWTLSGNNTGALSPSREVSVRRIRDCDTNKTITTVKGVEGAWGLQDLLDEIKTKLWGDK